VGISRRFRPEIVSDMRQLPGYTRADFSSDLYRVCPFFGPTGGKSNIGKRAGILKHTSLS
jgi:hypothetical protein